MARIQFDEKGREIPDPRPMAIPAGFQRPESLQDQIRRLIRVQMSQEAEGQGQESFDEANDFDVDDDDALPYSPYEEVEMQPETPVRRGKNASSEPEPAETEDGDAEAVAQNPDQPSQSGSDRRADRQPSKKRSAGAAHRNGKGHRPDPAGGSADED